MAIPAAGNVATLSQIDNKPLPERRSLQFRALSRRIATQHRRQWKLDLCCLGLCPA